MDADNVREADEAGELYYDPYDYEVDAHAHEVWRRLRDEAPLYWNDKYGFYVLSRFDDVLPAMLDTQTYSSAHMTVLEMMSEDASGGGMLIFMDPPEHTHLRKLVSRAFTPRAIGGLEDRVRRLCATYLDAFVGEESFDYVDQFAALVPPTVILALMGFPEGHVEEWRSGIDGMFHLEDGETGLGVRVGDRGVPEAMLDDTGQIGAGLFQMLPDLIAERRRRPEDDLISVLANSDLEDDDGTTRKLTDAEIFSFTTLLSIAGTETVARLLSWAAVLLARNPDQRRILVDDPGVIPNAIEETLRYEAPSPVNSRWVTRDVEHHGQIVRAGSKIALLNGSADRDERHFENADVYDVRRKIDRHLAFGYGAHFCVGAALARIESKIALEETLKRFPDWEIDDGELGWVHTSTVRGFAKVPIHLT
jgi:cytochrome P450